MCYAISTSSVENEHHHLIKLHKILKHHWNRMFRHFFWFMHQSLYDHINHWWKLRALLHPGTKFFTVTYSLESSFLSCPDKLHPLIKTIDFLRLCKESGIDYSNWRNVNYTLDSTLFFKLNSGFLCNFFKTNNVNKIKSQGWWESSEF